jgi:hypothetical protein
MKKRENVSGTREGVRKVINKCRKTKTKCQLRPRTYQFITPAKDKGMVMLNNFTLPFP